jgi:hypothetical protein
MFVIQCLTGGAWLVWQNRHGPDTIQAQGFFKKATRCHPERSEGSLSCGVEVLHFVQHDNTRPFDSAKYYFYRTVRMVIAGHSFNLVRNLGLRLFVMALA